MKDEAIGVSKEHITKTPGVCGGKACIAGTRIRVLDIAYEYRSGTTVSVIAERFSRSITQADVHAALAYYLDNIAEIEQLMKEDDEADEYGRLNPSPLTVRLRELKQQRGKSGVKTDPLPVG